jgi:hypothetical protein
MNDPGHRAVHPLLQEWKNANDRSSRPPHDPVRDRNVSKSMVNKAKASYPLYGYDRTAEPLSVAFSLWSVQA